MSTFPTPGSANPRPNGDLASPASSRAGSSYDKLEEKLSALASTVAHWQRDLDDAATRSSRLEGAFTVLLTSLEGWKSEIREVASRTESRVLRGLEVIDSRIVRVPPGGGQADHTTLLGAVQKLERAFTERMRELESDASKAVDPARLMQEGLARLDQRLQAIEQRMSAPDPQIISRLGESFEVLNLRLEAIEQKAVAQDAELPARLAASAGTLERKIADGLERLEYLLAQQKHSPQADTGPWDRLAEGQNRLLEAISRSAETSNLDGLVASLRVLESKMTDAQEALTRKLESVQAESDENNATQLRYLANLEELQATVGKRVQSLEGVVKNPLDAQQWERLAKGLEFLDTKLAHSYDSVANRLEKAIATLTATLDNRAAAGQEANLKSAERLWRALRGLEDQIIGSSDLIRQSQERLEAAAANVSGALEELRAVSGARAGHTEKLLMEGLENLDGRFAQNLMAVSETMSSALFALNKQSGEWRSELFNATEESEERLVSQIVQAESKIAAEIKAGLESIGRREERMLALILGGGAALTVTPGPEEAPRRPG